MSVVSMKQLLKQESILGTRPEGGIPKWQSTSLPKETVFISLTCKRRLKRLKMLPICKSVGSENKEIMFVGTKAGAGSIEEESKDVECRMSTKDGWVVC